MEYEVELGLSFFVDESGTMHLDTAANTDGKQKKYLGDWEDSFHAPVAVEALYMEVGRRVIEAFLNLADHDLIEGNIAGWKERNAQDALDAWREECGYNG